VVNSAANTAYYAAHCWLFQRRIEGERVYNVRVCAQGVRERLGRYGGLSVDVLWSWLHGRDGGCTTPLRLQVLLVLLRQVQDLHQDRSDPPLSIDTFSLSELCRVIVIGVGLN